MLTSSDGCPNNIGGDLHHSKCSSLDCLNGIKFCPRDELFNLNYEVSPLDSIINRLPDWFGEFLMAIGMTMMLIGLLMH